jgi:tRNA wybutosine-synthesizing protein 2
MLPVTAHQNHATKPSEKKRVIIRNPLQAGIWSIISALPSENRGTISLSDLPKRYTIYGPLLLLPFNFTQHTPVWYNLYASLDDGQKIGLFAAMAEAFTRAGQPVTHIAVNAPIPGSYPAHGIEVTSPVNVMRKPSNLQPLYGEFGPSKLLDATSVMPTIRDFHAAFWVSTQQSQGISQVWAPRWTMFSRGNITEKSRILQGRGGSCDFPGLTEIQLGHKVDKADIVDMYVGIGYFAFSYLARGVKRVWGWDLNPWSIEGLRRGCKANGWRCLVAEIGPNGELRNTTVAEIVKILSEIDEPVRCIAFCGNNKWATSILMSIRQILDQSEAGSLMPRIRHINLGLLPTSRQSWQDSLSTIDPELGGWIHVHENIEQGRIDARSAAIVEEMRSLHKGRSLSAKDISCHHVHEVKTYGPGVIHCVFDIFVTAES